VRVNQALRLSSITVSKILPVPATGRLQSAVEPIYEFGEMRVFLELSNEEESHGNNAN